jgi:putative transcriptional regulator
MSSFDVTILVTLDAVLLKRNMTGKQLAKQIGLSETQLSLFRSGKVRGIRFSTLASLCAALDCRPGDLIDYSPHGTDP